MSPKLDQASSAVVATQPLVKLDQVLSTVVDTKFLVKLDPVPSTVVDTQLFVAKAMIRKIMASIYMTRTGSIFFVIYKQNSIYCKFTSTHITTTQYNYFSITMETKRNFQFEVVVMS